MTYYSWLLEFTFAPATLKTGVALADNAAVTRPVKSDINIIPIKIHKMQNARAYGDFGERSPYLGGTEYIE